MIKALPIPRPPEYTVMVFRRAGLTVAQASLVLLSRNFCFGDGPERLFETVGVTGDVMQRVARFDGVADTIGEALLREDPPAPALVSACAARPRRPRRGGVGEFSEETEAYEARTRKAG